MKISVFWFRRDLRLTDNKALFKAFKSKNKVLPIFIFDSNIIDELPKEDPRVSFIYNQLIEINIKLSKFNSSILILQGNPLEIWIKLIHDYDIECVFVNKDYEPYARERDKQIAKFLMQNGISFAAYKDLVIYEENEIIKDNGKPYSVYTPYKNKWLRRFEPEDTDPIPQPDFNKLYKYNHDFPTLNAIGFIKSGITVKDYSLRRIDEYETLRDFPAEDGTSYLSPHLRFGTIGIRELIQKLKPNHASFLNELIWREFFMQILFHYPELINQNFYRKYDNIRWRNNTAEFKKWCNGLTGYPIVDAGMRQLNETGYMHNRVRMITAGFLCKHLLIDWRWGEAYFAQKLLDYELSSNNGNWQWAAGTGCDASPYFRVFNPTAQMDKFDKQAVYVKRWVPEYGTGKYAKPIVDHAKARLRAITVYKEAVNEKLIQ